MSNNLSERQKLINILILGFGFCLIFSAFQTTQSLSETITSASSSNSSFTGNGYVSNALIYASFALANWIAPVVIHLLTAKLSLILSALTYAIFVAQFLYLETWSFYLTSILVGFGAAILWTAQGNLLHLNSTPETISRNSGLFYGIFQSNFIWGNIAQFFLFHGKSQVTQNLRRILFGIFTAFSLIGTAVLLLIRKGASVSPSATSTSESTDNLVREHDRRNRITHQDRGDEQEEQNLRWQKRELETATTNDDDDKEETFSTKEAFLNSFRLIRQPRLLLLLIVCFYTGLQQSYMSGVFSTLIGNTLSYGSNAKSYIGICGIVIGAGEFVCSIGFGYAEKRISWLDKAFVVVCGFVFHAAAFFLSLINFPWEATVVSSTSETYISPSSLPVSIVIGFLCGAGDSAFNTPLMSVLSDMYSGIDSPSAFALLKFFQSLATSTMFLITIELKLHLQWLMLLLGSMATVSVFLFIVAHNSFYAEQRRRNRAQPILSGGGGETAHHGVGDGDSSMRPPPAFSADPHPQNSIQQPVN